MRVVSIGDLVTDFYYKNGKLIGVNGGMTSHNIIANIAKMKLDTVVYGACGDDMAGNIAIKSLSDIGVNTENIQVVQDLNTRCFHVSYFENDGKLEFKSKKRCPICNEKRWYESSKIDSNKILKSIKQDDILIFDNLNKENQKIIDSSQNRKMLDLGQYFELDNYSDKEIINKLSGKFDIINLNERVKKYLKNRFNLKDLEDIYKMIHPNLIIVTRGKKGSDFICHDFKVTIDLENPAEEIDPTGAGDAFFSVFISEYIKNNFIISHKFIEDTFKKATKLTKKVVKSFGARGHINSLYKIKKITASCTCQNFEVVVRKQIKRCNLNINNLETRILNALNSKAFSKLKEINFKNMKSSLFVGTGESFAGAKFASKVINNLYGINTLAILPRDVYYRNNSTIDSTFLFTYSGTTNDLYIGTSNIDNQKKYIITKGEVQKVVTKMGIPKSNVITYRTSTNKGKERGFLAFEGALSPASLFLKVYFDGNKEEVVEDFIKDCISYWKKYFKNYFKENKKELKIFLTKGSTFNIFTGDFTESASTDLESKIIESGIFNCIIHEKKNFSHGRFINYEHLSAKKNIYFKSKSVSLYESKLLEYLKNDQNIIIESRYDGLLCEYDLLIASQYFMYYIANFLDIDISKPTYSEENDMKLFFYKGKL